MVRTIGLLRIETRRPGLKPLSIMGIYARLKRLCRNYSFAPSGLAFNPLFTQGLRPGLHSCAASRLKGLRASHFFVQMRVVTQSLKGRSSTVMHDVGIEYLVCTVTR